MTSSDLQRQPAADATTESGEQNRRMSLAAGVAWLSGVLAAAWGVDAGLYAQSRGWPFVGTAALAALVCWVSGVLALVSTVVLTRAKQSLAAVLSGTLFRTGGPMLALLVGTLVPGLAAAGFPGQVVVFFLVMLATETFLVVRITGVSLTILFRQ
jgi:hypothetical protein